MLNYEGPYRRHYRRQRRRARQLAARIILIMVLVTIAAIVLIRLDTVMAAQRIHDKTMSDCMDQLMYIRQDIDALQEGEPEQVSLGEYTITHYCLENYPHICNDGESRHTASGQAPVPYYTVAADESIPFGTKLVIDGVEYKVMDRSGAITEGRIDIAVPTHEEAISRGRITREVYVR